MIAHSLPRRAFGGAIAGLLFCAATASAQVPPAPNYPPNAVLRIPAGLTFQAESHIVSSNGGSQPPFTGVNINARVGADAFYSAGYSGSAAIVANIEGGHVWNGHETLSGTGHIAQYINGPGTVGALNGTSAAFDRHATWVGHALGGRTTTTGGGEHQRGVAYGATMWSGSIATQWVGSTSFQLTFNSFFQPYVAATRTGIGGQTADVVNSSWGLFSTSNQDNLYADISSGRHDFAWAMDALVRDTNKVYVFSAGNSGSAQDTVAAPATAYNVISVGSLGSDQSNPTYDTVSGFSSRGPNRAYDVNTGAYLNSTRVRVDITAPGENLTLAYYGGNTGGNAGGTNDTRPNLYNPNMAGTSFAAPLVAAGATLLVDAGRQLSLPNSADGRVIKSILLNSADKTAGWNNGQALDNGIIATSQALDANVGAGRMNLARALPYFTDPNSTRDVPGTGQGNLGTVQLRGYDFGQVQETGGTTNSYRIAGGTQEAGSALTVTLTWFINRGINSFTAPTEVTENAYSDLDVEVWRLVGGNFDTLVATSFTQFNNTEHLYLTNLPEGEYGIRVVYFGDNWDFVQQSAEHYALAWELRPVPEPGGVLAVALVGLAGGAVARRRLARAAART